MNRLLAALEVGRATLAVEFWLQFAFWAPLKIERDSWVVRKIEDAADAAIAAKLELERLR